mmetsp:Transcript_57532/g.125912  ORF Transcript_57532/g.125912 Transcript_57532/m.125912 type:complete len:260 (+) Transcript_57532:1007-1786(+)
MLDLRVGLDLLIVGATHVQQLSFQRKHTKVLPTHFGEPGHRKGLGRIALCQYQRAAFSSLPCVHRIFQLGYGRRRPRRQGFLHAAEPGGLHGFDGSVQHTQLRHRLDELAGQDEVKTQLVRGGGESCLGLRIEIRVIHQDFDDDAQILSHCCIRGPRSTLLGDHLGDAISDLVRHEFHVRPVAAADAIHKAQRRKAALLGEGHGHLGPHTALLIPNLFNCHMISQRHLRELLKALHRECFIVEGHLHVGTGTGSSIKGA